MRRHPADRDRRGRCADVAVMPFVAENARRSCCAATRASWGVRQPPHGSTSLGPSTYADTAAPSSPLSRPRTKESSPARSHARRSRGSARPLPRLAGRPTAPRPSTSAHDLISDHSGGSRPMLVVLFLASRNRILNVPVGDARYRLANGDPTREHPGADRSAVPRSSPTTTRSVNPAATPRSVQVISSILVDDRVTPLTCRFGFVYVLRRTTFSAFGTRGPGLNPGTPTRKSWSEPRNSQSRWT